jgi:hypothetical protein
MNVKTLQVLAAITVPVTALAIALPPPQTAPVPVRGSGPLLPGLIGKIGDGSTLVVTGADGHVTLRHAGTKPYQGWGLADKGGYPVPDAKIKPVLDDLAALRGLEPKTERAALYSRLDLGNPGPGAESHEVSLADAKGAVDDAVILGRHKEDASGNGHERIYARQPDRPRSWLAAPAVTLPGEALDWIDRGVVDLNPDKIKQITITQADGSSVTLARAKAGDKLTLQGLPAGAKPKTDTAGTDVANAWQSLDLADVKPAAQVTGAKVAGAKVATAHAVTFDGLSVDLAFVKQDGQSWAMVTAAGGKDAAAIDARTKGWAYQIADAKAAPLESKLADLVTLPPPPPSVAAPPKAVPPEHPVAAAGPAPASPAPTPAPGVPPK